MEHVVLINPFTVEAEHVEKFLEAWHAAADYLRKQPGFMSTKLHRSLDANARFRFVNVAIWKSPKEFSTAVGTPEFQEIAAAMPTGAIGSPALYRVEA